MNYLHNLDFYQISKKYIWIILGSIVLALRVLASNTPQYVEQFYSRGLYPIIRWLFDHSLAYIPFPLLYCFYAISLYYLFKIFKIPFNKSTSLSKRLSKFIFSLISFFSFLIFGFMLTWGFHYARPSYSSQIQLDIVEMDSLALFDELKIAASEAIYTRQKLSDTPLSIQALPRDIEDKMRLEITHLLENQGFKAGGKLRGRFINPDGILNRFGISGIYMPYIGEANVDDGLHDFEKPYTLAHEMSHGYGWTEEATANFIAYLTCTQSQDLYIQYSGFLSHFRYVASNCKRLNKEGYQRFRDSLPMGIKADLDAINQRQKMYPNWFETEKINDAFLKAQGVSDGTKSYSKVVVLVHSWRLKNGFVPL